MPIPEDQLVTWTGIGAIQGSSTTYGMIQDALQDPNAPFARRRAVPFLQGSYGTNTNVWGVESDVDIVYVLRSVVVRDIRRLDADAYVAHIFNDTHNAASYNELQRFKWNVAQWLNRKYPRDVSAGSKAIKIAANGGRRKADVLPCVEFHKYRSNSNGKDQNYDIGICFMKTDGRYIANFPYHHRKNCQDKHQATGEKFKRVVRIFKNMRNRLVERGQLRDGIALSYFIEGLIYNYPTPMFVVDFRYIVPNVMNWFLSADPSKLMCANGFDPMFGPDPDLSWKIGDFTTYLYAILKLWDEWR